MELCFICQKIDSQQESIWHLGGRLGERCLGEEVTTVPCFLQKPWELMLGLMGTFTVLIATAVVLPVYHLRQLSLNCSLTIYNLLFMDTKARKRFFCLFYFTAKLQSENKVVIS